MEGYRIFSPGCTMYYDLLYPCCRLREDSGMLVADSAYQDVPTWASRLPWGSVEMRSFPWLQQHPLDPLQLALATEDTSTMPTLVKGDGSEEGYWLRSPGCTMRYELLYPCCRVRQSGGAMVADKAYRGAPTWVCKLPWGAIEVRSFPWLEQYLWWSEPRSLPKHERVLLQR